MAGGPPAYAPDLPTRETSVAWMTAERLNLHAAASYGADHNLPHWTIAMAATMHGFLREVFPAVSVKFLLALSRQVDRGSAAMLNQTHGRRLGQHYREVEYVVDAAHYCLPISRRALPDGDDTLCRQLGDGLRQ